MSFAMTGAGFNAAGRQASAGARLYLQQHGNMVAGKKIEMILRDDAGVADNARRLVQEMIVNDKVAHHRRRHHADRARLSGRS